MSDFNQPQERPQVALAMGQTYPAKVLEIIDGDGIRLETQAGDKPMLVEVRLFGIDAPEHDQPHGNDATSALGELAFQHRDWNLEIKLPSDRYGRVVGLLYPSGGTVDRSLNRQLVQRGMAYWDPRYAPQGEHGIAHAEFEARISRRGLWERSPRDGDTRPWNHRDCLPDDFLDEVKQNESLAELNEMRAQLNEWVLEREWLRQENETQLNTLRRQVSNLERELTTLRGQSGIWRLDGERLRSEKDELVRKLKQLGTAAGQPISQLASEDTDTQLKHTEQENTQLRDELDEAVAELSQAQETIRHLRRESTVTSSHTEQHRDTSQSLQGGRTSSPTEAFLSRNRLPTHEIEIARLKKRNNAQTEQLRDLGQDYQRVTAQLERVQLSLHRIEEENTGLKRDFSEPHTTYQLLRTEIKTIEADRTRMQRLLMQNDASLGRRLLRWLIGR